MTLSAHSSFHSAMMRDAQRVPWTFRNHRWEPLVMQLATVLMGPNLGKFGPPRCLYARREVPEPKQSASGHPTCTL